MGLKKLYLGLWNGMLKNYWHIYNQRPPICLIAKFRAKIRIPKFGTKNALFGCFGQQFWKTFVIFASSALNFAFFFLQKIKKLKFGPKNARFPYIGTGILKHYCNTRSQRPHNYLVVKFGAKIKVLKFGTKNASYTYF